MWNADVPKPRSPRKSGDLRSVVDEEGIVTVISVPQAFNEEELYVDLRSIFAHPLFLKCEGFNFAGSIKLKAAAAMVEAADRDGVLTPDSILVESSSGNLGVALSMIAASKGYPVFVRDRLPLQLVDQAADGGAGQRGARHNRR